MSTVPVGDIDILAMSPAQFYELLEEDHQLSCAAPYSKPGWPPLGGQKSSRSTSSSPFSRPTRDQIFPVNPLGTIDRTNDWLKDHTYVDMFGWKDAIFDGRTAVRQVRLLGIMGDAYLKTTSSGQEVVIFKGYAGLREKLPGTRYLREHPVVHAADFVIGHKEMLEEAGKATKIAVICFVAWDIVHECLRDKPDMTHLGVSILSDIFQAVAATYIGVAAGLLIGAASATAAPIVVTFIVVASVTFLAGGGMAWLDSRYSLTEKAVEIAKDFERSDYAKTAISYAKSLGKYFAPSQIYNNPYIAF